MIKRTSRNFKVPLVYGGQWKDHQSFQKWDPISKRLVTVNCCLPKKCFKPETPTNVQLSNILTGSVVITWDYVDDASEQELFEINIYQSLYDPVDTTTPPIYSAIRSISSGDTVLFNPISNFYYAAIIRTRNTCLFSEFSEVSNSIQYVFTGYNFVVNSLEGATSTDNPGAGKINIFDEFFAGPLYSGLTVSETDNIGQDMIGFLNSLAGASAIKIQKDIDNYQILTRRPNYQDEDGFWYFGCIYTTIIGRLNVNDVVNITFGNF